MWIVTLIMSISLMLALSCSSDNGKEIPEGATLDFEIIDNDERCFEIKSGERNKENELENATTVCPFANTSSVKLPKGSHYDQ